MDRYRLWVISAIVGILAVIDGMQPIYLSDFQTFAIAGRRMLSADGLNVFDFGPIQVGPLHLAFDGIVALIADVFVIDPQIILSVTVQVGFVLGLIFAARLLTSFTGRRLSSWIEAGLAAVATVMTMPWTLYVTGHHGEGFIALLWVFAGVQASRDRQERAGLLIAASALLQAWGILGIPLLLFGPKKARWWRGLSVALGVTALIYSPFFLFGDVQTFTHEVTVTSTDTLTSFFMDDGEPFTWRLRVLQAAATLAVGFGGVILLKKRGSFHAIWALPVVMTGMRLLLDPSADWYQWIAAQTFVLVGMALLLTVAHNRMGYFLAAAGYPLFLTWPSGFNGAWALAYGILVLFIGTSEPLVEPADDLVPEPEANEPVLPPVTTSV